MFKFGFDVVSVYRLSQTTTGLTSRSKTTSLTSTSTSPDRPPSLNRARAPSWPRPHERHNNANTSVWKTWSVLESLTHRHVSDSQLDTLPDRISYSPIHVPGLDRPLLRRDLFDARFQLYQRDSTDKDDSTTNTGTGIAGQVGAALAEVEGEEYVDSSTDLVPGLYEGGLKTWEGGVDLVEVLNGVSDLEKWVRGASVLEVSLCLRSLLHASCPDS